MGFEVFSNMRVGRHSLAHPVRSPSKKESENRMPLPCGKIRSEKCIEKFIQGVEKEMNRPLSSHERKIVHGLYAHCIKEAPLKLGAEEKSVLDRRRRILNL